MSKLWFPPSRGACLQGTLCRYDFHHVKTNSRIICRTVHTSKPPQGYRHRQLSVQITNNRDTPDTKFWRHSDFNALKPSKNAWKAYWKEEQAKEKHHPGLVILFTPSLLSWLNDETFIPKILKKISHAPKAELENSSPVVYDVMCACVDGIAPEEHYGTFHEQPATEGISFLHTPSYKVFGYTDLLKSKETDGTTESLPLNIPAAITFGKSYSRLDHVTVPLANTIFQNGKPSFLQHTRWDVQDGEFTLSKKWDDKRFTTIYAFYGINKPLLSFLPARPVTPFRTIESGMGNIVREICFDEGDVGPASRELETVVSEISNSLGGSTVDIWALLVPNEVVSAVAENAPERGPEYVGFWLDKGATMCRVVSGGGGWGLKQGLLSLDPQTRYDTTEVSSGWLGEKDVTSLGNLAQPGTSIQFLAVDNDLPPPIAAQKVQSTSERKSIVFGTIPSTIDEIPNAISEEQETKYTYRVGHFGCVSGSGIFYRHDRPKPKEDPKVDAGAKSSKGPDPNQEAHSTLIYSKIDLPYSYLYMDGCIAQRQAQNAIEKESLKESPNVFQSIASPKQEELQQKEPKE